MDGYEVARRLRREPSLDGICLVALWPHAVQSVAQGALWRVRWTGRPVPEVAPA